MEIFFLTQILQMKQIFKIKIWENSRNMSGIYLLRSLIQRVSGRGLEAIRRGGAYSPTAAGENGNDHKAASRFFQ